MVIVAVAIALLIVVIWFVHQNRQAAYAPEIEAKRRKKARGRIREHAFMNGWQGEVLRSIAMSPLLPVAPLLWIIFWMGEKIGNGMARWKKRVGIEEKTPKAPKPLTEKQKRRARKSTRFMGGWQGAVYAVLASPLFILAPFLWLLFWAAEKITDLFSVRKS